MANFRRKIVCTHVIHSMLYNPWQFDKPFPFWKWTQNMMTQWDDIRTFQCVSGELSSMYQLYTASSVQREWILKVREVKVKNKSLSLFPRNEKWIKNLVHSFSRSESEKKSLSLFFEKWKVKWKSSSLFSRMKSEMKMPRDRDREVKFLENSREILKFWSKRFPCRKF